MALNTTSVPHIEDQKDCENLLPIAGKILQEEDATKKVVLTLVHRHFDTDSTLRMVHRPNGHHEIIGKFQSSEDSAHVHPYLFHVCSGLLVPYEYIHDKPVHPTALAAMERVALRFEKAGLAPFFGMTEYYEGVFVERSYGHGKDGYTVATRDTDVRESIPAAWAFSLKDDEITYEVKRKCEVVSGAHIVSKPY